MILILFISSCGESDNIIKVEMQTTEDKIASKINQSLTTTRDKCKECGCEASYISCKCPTKKTLDCVLEDAKPISNSQEKPNAPELGPVKDSI